MTSREDELRAAVAAGVLIAGQRRAGLLQSIADVARAIFGARASSIMLFDAAREELVFEAVSGEGHDLLGRRLPKDTGLAGWVLAAREPIVVEDVAQDPRFAVDVARSTGYVPQGIMAAPLLLDERALGVLSILDRPRRAAPSLDELDLLGLFADQAAVALELFEAVRRVGGALGVAASWPPWPGSPPPSTARERSGFLPPPRSWPPSKACSALPTEPPVASPQRVLPSMSVPSSSSSLRAAFSGPMLNLWPSTSGSSSLRRVFPSSSSSSGRILRSSGVFSVIETFLSARATRCGLSCAIYSACVCDF